MKKILYLIFFITSIKNYCQNQKHVYVTNKKNYDLSFISKVKLENFKTNKCFELNIEKISLGKFQDYSKQLEKLTKINQKEFKTALGFNLKNEKLIGIIIL